MASDTLGTSKQVAALEALLFYYGEPMTVPRIAKLLRLSEPECEQVISAWTERLVADGERGLTVVRRGNEVQLATKPEFHSVGEAIIREEFREALTPAGLETLSIVAYLGPVLRSTIDYVRGVNSSFTVRNLLMRGLIDRSPDPERGHAFRYFVSFDFLTHMGIAHVEDLPEYERYRQVLQEFETAPPDVEGTQAPKNL